MFRFLRQTVRMFRSQCTLPVYELQRAHVKKSKSQIRPFDPARGFTRDPLCPNTPTRPTTLSLGAWRLAHAVKKADALRVLSHPLATRLGFLLEHLPTFHWIAGNLRLAQGVTDGYQDFVGAGFAGRIGQGLTLLTMENRGYHLVAHYPSRPGTRAPDFVMQSARDGHKALVESKGSFVAPQESRPPIKGVLNEAIEQLESGPALGATKSFAVATFLREFGDTHPEPSLVALVDPDLEADPTHNPPVDWVVRANYAAALDLMRLHAPAERLRHRVTRGSSERFLLRVLRTRQGVFAVSFPALDSVPNGIPWSPLGGWRGGRLVIAGLRVSVLGAISATLSGASETLEEHQGPPTATDPMPASPVPFEGSILKDGSILGDISLANLIALPVQEFLL